MDFLHEELLILKEKNLYRIMKTIDGPSTSRTIVDGRNCILLSSNNYLGLTEHPEIKKAFIEAVKKWGAGSGASRLISGNLRPHMELEKEIARFKRTESAIVFNTGYMANIGVITALAEKGDIVISDQLNHASIIDGCRLSGSEIRVYRHKDMAHLKDILRCSRGYRRRLIITDGVFSMDGDIAPLPEIVALAGEFNALVMVDDAHATGVLGHRGSGTAEYFGLEGKIAVQMGTLSKALGNCGAYVAGNPELIDYLRNKARSFIFSTSLPPAVVGASIAAVKILERHPEIIKKLWANADYLRAGLKNLGYSVLSDETPIIPILTRDESRTLQLGMSLLDKGVFAPAIRPPTVPPGTCRIRVTVMASHSTDDLDEALDAFEKAGRETGII
ncbi:MAG: 8-amino-7-oxononanoate synthase [Bacillota bacterium]